MEPPPGVQWAGLARTTWANGRRGSLFARQPSYLPEHAPRVRGSLAPTPDRRRAPGRRRREEQGVRRLATKRASALARGPRPGEAAVLRQGRAGDVWRRRQVEPGNS